MDKYNSPVSYLAEPLMLPIKLNHQRSSGRTPTNLKRLKPGDRAILSLPLVQVDLIHEKVQISEHLLSIIYAAKVRDDVVRMKCSLDDLDQLSKHVENNALCTKDMKLRAELGAIFDSIRNLEQSYYGAKLRIVPSRLTFEIESIVDQ